jgi:hypothetical protein
MIAQSSPSPWPWLVLVSRLSIFVLIQALFALGFWLAGSTSAWANSADWWPIVVTLTNVLSIFLMSCLLQREGKHYRELFCIRKENILRDALTVLGLFLIGGPLSYLPNPLLAKALWGDVQVVLPLLVRPLPLWAAYASLILFPLTQGLAELASYFGYSMPRLESQGMRPWLAITLPALVLGLQHIAVPLLFDLHFILWRGLMFLPFAFFVGIVLHWRPRLLPYMAIVHVLMDLSFAIMLISAAY